MDVKITDLLEELIKDICDNYCKYSAAYADSDEDFLYEKICANCPLVKNI